MGDIVLAVSIFSILFVLWAGLIGTLVGSAREEFNQGEYGVGALYVAIDIAVFFIGVGFFMKLLGL